MFLLPNVTALEQPMDQCIIENLKRIYRKQDLRRLLLAENDEESVAAFAEKLNMKDVCYMLVEAWDSLE
ncbi:DDE-1 domain-containing protein [Trichonephila clavipes]|nr:DDE-1 domain-containing protein [Trichonephila clavipes]GFT71858.1 DDE-1 domain-containing protein [Trichonephila clavipes]